jgi:hypothetical protein
MSTNSRHAAAEKKVPWVFFIELFSFNQDSPSDTKLLPGSNTKLQNGMNQILAHMPDQNTAFCDACGGECPSHKLFGRWED